MSIYEFIKTRMEDEISVITIDNPPVNALNLKLLSELQDALEVAEADSNVRGIIITGAGNHTFSAGAEIKMLQQSKPEDAVEIVRQGHKTLNRLNRDTSRLWRRSMDLPLAEVTNWLWPAISEFLQTARGLASPKCS